jgi:hypothetical protein
VNDYGGATFAVARTADKTTKISFYFDLYTQHIHKRMSIIVSVQLLKRPPFPL